MGTLHKPVVVDKQKDMAAVCFLVLAFLHTGLLVSATNLHVVNNAGSTVCAKYWVPTSQVGGGCRELRPGQAWDVATSPAWQAATMWAIVGSCAGQPCNTGPPTGVTQFEFTVGGFSNTDYYDVSMKAGFNLGVSVGPTNSACSGQECIAPDRCQGFIPGGPDRTKACPYGTTDYVIVFY